MPDTVLTSWVHGTSMQTEYPNRLTSVRHIGPFARIEGSAGQNTWVHFPVPTPALVGDDKLQVSAVLLNFRTRSDQAWVHEVVLYDGATTIAAHRELHLSGDHTADRFEVQDRPELGSALNITVGIQFGTDFPNIQSTWMEFIAAGCELIQQD